ncbi:hypothetical protein CS006_02670 [Bifidobacterium primatium]|uniref:YfhO family protein n=1 Tax=Bifidobacterium primatium TaxID=2045438 RepID=A0A2M9HB74_9BIFI|nr:YfhO family protein [Bifidobacterium primatium]PJM74065.1 hypothetical protein CS006_02670 [Bifidobacterium primatium]
MIVSKISRPRHGKEGRHEDVSKQWSARRIIVPSAVVLGVIGMLLYVYHSIVFGNWNYSYTNCLYRWKPFSSLNVETGGFCYSDISDNVLPIAYSTIHQGIFTAWVPSFSIGAPQGINLYFSPLNYLYMLPFGAAMLLIAIVKVVGAFAGMYLFVKQMGYSARGGFIAGTTYALSAAMVTWQGWPHTEVGMYAPWLFLVLDKLIRELKVRYMVETAIIVFLMLTAGMPTFAAYFFYLAFAYAVFYTCRTHWNHWKTFAATLVAGIGSVVIGVVMSLPYTGGLLTSVGSNGYSESRAGWSSIGLELPQLKTLLFPFLATSTTRNNIESMLYTGVLAIITLGLVIINFRKKPRVGFFAVTSAIVLLLLFTPVFDVIFTHMPMVNTSYKFRIVILLNFALAILAGINIDDLFAHVPSELVDKLKIWGVLAIGFIVFALVAWRTRNTELTAHWTGANQKYVVYVSAALAFVVLLLATCITGKGRGVRVLSQICSVAICAIVVLDTGFFAAQYLPLTQKGASAIPPATQTIQYLQAHTKNGEKIVSKNVDFPVDSPMFYNLRDIRGHGLSMTNEDIKAYYSAIDPSAYTSSPTNTIFLNTKNENLLRYIGVKYIVSSPNQENNPEYSSGAGMKTVGNDGLLVKELDNPAPNVQLVSNVQVYKTNAQVLAAMGKEYQGNTVFFSKEYGVPQGESTRSVAANDADTTAGVVSIDQKSNGNMIISTKTSSDQYLLVNEYDDGNWKAYIDGQETSIYKGNGLFRAIKVPSGSHRIELEYKPTTLYRFFAVAGVGVVLLIGLAVFSKKENVWLRNLRDTEYSAV